MTTSLNKFVGCCGAYCKTCKPYNEGFCKGCKLAYDTGERDIGKAKCKIKVCCIRDNNLDTCADCKDLNTCRIIGSWYANNGYKYKKYKQAITFIAEHGYSEFITIADKWTNAYGKYE